MINSAGKAKAKTLFKIARRPSAKRLVSKLTSQASSRDLGLFSFGGLAMQLYLKRLSLVLHLLFGASIELVDG